MSTNTRIFLAVVAVLVGVLVVYYGVLSDGGAPAISRASSPADLEEFGAGGEPEPELDEAEGLGTRTAKKADVSDPPSAGLADTDTSVEEPVSDVPGTERTNVPGGVQPQLPEPIGDFAPVVLGETVDFGGKDGPQPPQSPGTETDSAEAADDASNGDAAEGVKGEEQAPPDSEPAEGEQPRASARPQYMEYTVEANDTMSSIAQEWFGDATRWDLIAKANPLVDPTRLQVGQLLRLPPRNAEREEIEGKAGRTAVVYTVRSGDTLSRIARAYYGSERHWRLIYEANRPTIGTQPNDLKPGMKLTIPPAPKPARKAEDDENGSSAADD